ncbi:IS3 family transposase [Actinomyces trachealis]|uniref:IS3 family transposase n=1 Tax=Actinomyces trachealis TaxID=2763540 RepID=UPI0039A545EA
MRPACARALRDEVLVEEVKPVHAESYGVYGVCKMHHAMLCAGWQIGRDQVARLDEDRRSGRCAPWPQAGHHTPCQRAEFPPRFGGTQVHRGAAASAMGR